MPTVCKLAIVSLVVACAAAVLASGANAAPERAPANTQSAAETAKKKQAKRPPVKAVSVGSFGKVLTTKGGQALYYWTPEKQRKGKIFCVGGCAVIWPVLTLKKGQKYRKWMKGIPGKFGAIRRPDGRRQLTHRGLPLYTYANEARLQVLCDNVDGWFVVRAGKKTRTSVASPGSLRDVIAMTSRNRSRSWLPPQTFTTSIETLAR
jgi:predicted lipoprotein with Yx(FWY)xxD motif